MNEEAARHAARKAALIAPMHALPHGEAAPLGLSKRGSNLFRDRAEGNKRRLDLGEFDHVIEVDSAHGWVDVEGSTSYEDLVDATLPNGVMPGVVPQLKTITVGGAVAGIGIEATSFRQGLVHDTMLECDVLLPGGNIVTCTPENEHRDLFFGFPNSYGTLGYALRVRLRTLPVKGFVRVEHRRYAAAHDFFKGLSAACDEHADFVDGVVFAPELQVKNAAQFVDEAPWSSDYTFKQIYYRSLPDKPLDYMSTRDYLWRWDTDWFWCSKNLGAQHPLVRRLLGRKRLNSRTYTRFMHWNARWGVTRRLARWRGRYPESVIQDVDIPVDRANEFLAFLLRKIGILPIWVCPIRSTDLARRFTLYPLAPGTAYFNFGFWDVVDSSLKYETGHFNRLVEHEVLRLGGIKSLYSDCFFTRDEFARAYNADQYGTLKAKYDPRGAMLGLYDKCVLRG